MPHFGQEPGWSRTISGCIGQVYCVPFGVASGVGAAVRDIFPGLPRTCSGSPQSRNKRHAHRGARNASPWRGRRSCRRPDLSRTDRLRALSGTWSGRSRCRNGTCGRRARRLACRQQGRRSCRTRGPALHPAPCRHACRRLRSTLHVDGRGWSSAEFLEAHIGALPTLSSYWKVKAVWTPGYDAVADPKSSSIGYREHRTGGDRWPKP